MNRINLTIDGKPITAAAGQTVRQAARQAGIDIPGICDHEKLSPYGACRLCVVEIGGIRGYPTACTTPAAEGMVVQTQSQGLTTLRNRVLEMTMSGHPNACLVCDHRESCEKHKPHPAKAGHSTRCSLCSNRPDCDLRTLALQATSRELDLKTIYSVQNLERDDPFIDRDLNLCILCARCWRICESIHGRPAISILNRGKQARVGTAFNKSWVDSGCTFCGACIDICPTGTLSDRYARWYGVAGSEFLSTCTLCPEGCALYEQVLENRIIGTRMTDLDRDARLCAIGRFAYAQLINTPHRLERPLIREQDDLIPVSWDEAIAFAARQLAPFKGSGEFAVLAGEAEIRETNFLYEKFAVGFMQGRVVRLPAAAGNETAAVQALKSDIRSGKVKAAIVTGDYLDEETLAALQCLIVADFVPSPAAGRAHAVFPVAILSEVTGTFRNAAGEVKTVGPITTAPGQAQVEWRIIRDLAKAMGADSFNYDAVYQAAKDIHDDPAPVSLGGSPRDRLAGLPARFRGHNLADHVPGLEAMGLPCAAVKADAKPTEGFLVVQKAEVAANFHLITLQAPAIAGHARPGQFIMIMARETSERVPFTLADWDAKEGTITFVVEEVGRSSREMASLRQGDFVAHVSGPLGVPLPIEKVGSVILGGGCYGIAAIYPLARAFKQAGNKVIGVLEASSHFLFYMEDKLKSVCDELHYATRDGSRGIKGGVQDIFVERLNSGERPALMVAVGCTFMMRLTEEATRPFDVPLHVALNPIMVDGTGMCGACRLSVNGETKFACVDGPFFDAHKVDWEGLSSRRLAYAVAEIEALPQDATHIGVPTRNPWGGSEPMHAHGCSPKSVSS
jgi:NADH dehydrogenase/NADH:ubiquinone oxidoreductase subunit G/NAD(P)H-flavin reductase